MFPKKAPPFGKSSGIDAPEPVDAPPKPLAKAQEAPPAEGEMDYGAKLVADIEAAGQAEGMDPDTSRRVAGAMFSAAAKCLARSVGGGEGEGEFDAGGIAGEQADAEY